MANTNSDILNQISGSIGQGDLTELVQHLTESVDELNASLLNMSQSNAQDRWTDRYNSNLGGPANHFRNNYRNRNNRPGGQNGRTQYDSFTDEFERSLWRGFLGSNFDTRIRNTFVGFADALGTSVRDIPGAIGQELSRQAIEAVRNSDGLMGRAFQRAQGRVSGLADRAREGFLGRISNEGVDSELGSLRSNFDEILSGGDVAGAAQNIQALAGGAENVAGLITNGLGGAIQAVGPELLAMAGPVAAVAAGLVLLDIGLGDITQSFKELGEKWNKLMEGVSKSSKREQESRKKMIELGEKRMMDDVNTLITRPFKLLEEAAEAAYSVWDNNLRLITATQGYDKADVQDLMSAFSQRIQNEGLTDVVAGTSVLENLAKVIQSGLSGQIAEEFAYQATILQAAIPSQDFFNYAATYSSIAANAIKDGKSQSQAIDIANKSLQDFASNLLYASRELAGGFSTGLTNAASIYEQSAKIAQAARTQNTDEISGVLTSVAAMVGAVAPDLATSLTDAIYQAATGGNSSTLVALRSLAGGNASNTEFLKSLANNPQQVFTTLFTNLASMFGSSDDAYMEKAEGYAQLFGLSSEAFQRIDFNYLAKAISEMNVNNNTLEQNLKLLASGETTITKEQQKNRQINEYLLNEGLSYVLDNEVAREIQKHMWDEQIAQSLMEAEYGVELRGAALEFLEAIKNAVANVVNLLNPFAWGKKIANLLSSDDEVDYLTEDIQKVLELGNVGAQNIQKLSQLMTVGTPQSIVSDLVTLMGGNASYSQRTNFSMTPGVGLDLVGGLAGGAAGLAAGGAANLLSSVVGSYSPMRQMSFSGGVRGIADAVGAAINGGLGNQYSSKYNWGVITKSQGSAAGSILSKLGDAISGTLPGLAGVKKQESATESAFSSLKNNIQSMLEEVDSFVKEKKTYEEWASTAGKYGIADFNKAVEEAGYTESSLKQYFEDKSVEEGAQETQRLKALEEQFYNESHEFYTKQFPEEYRDVMFSKMDAMYTLVEEFQKSVHTDLIENVDAHVTAFSKNWLTAWTLFIGESVVRSGWNVHTANLKQLANDFSNYFIQHKIYDASGYNYTKIAEVQKAEKNEHDDAVYALAEALTANTVELKDPQVQTNALLSQILIVVDAIMKQHNETPGGVSLIDTLSALSLGMTVKS